MAKILTLDEMLEVAIEERLPSAGSFRAVLEEVGSILANALGAHLKVDVSPNTFEGVDLGGITASFKPLFEGQSLPKSLARFDPESDWSSESTKNNSTPEHTSVTETTDTEHQSDAATNNAIDDQDVVGVFGYARGQTPYVVHVDEYGFLNNKTKGDTT